MISIFFAQDQNEESAMEKGQREIFLKQKLEEEEKKNKVKRGTKLSESGGKPQKYIREKCGRQPVHMCCGRRKRAWRD